MKKKTRKDDNDCVLKCYSLFGDSADIGVDSRNNNSKQKKVEKDKASVPEKPVRSQDSVKEPNVSKQRVKDTGNPDKQGKSADKKNRTADNPKTVRSSRQGQRNKISESGDSKPQRPDIDKQGTDRKSAADDGGTKGGTGKGTKRQKVNYFPKSNTLLSTVRIDSAPVATDEFDMVEISVKGEHYHVSPWAVVKGEYIQGLDSKFLVHSFVANKRQINKEKQDI